MLMTPVRNSSSVLWTPKKLSKTVKAPFTSVDETGEVNFTGVIDTVKAPI
jgi:hypothetical protein